MNSNWPPWFRQSPSNETHSNEIEHRLTSIEHNVESLDEAHDEAQEQLKEKHEQLQKRLSLHEKAILALAGFLQILAQDKYPQIAKLIRGILIP